MSGYGYLVTTARTIRRNRTLEQQQAIARRGENPMTGKWWPFWKPWTHTTDPVRSIMTRFTTATGRRAGQKTSPRKTDAARQNGPRGARYGHLGARYGSLGPAARARKQGAA